MEEATIINYVEQLRQEYLTPIIHTLKKYELLYKDLDFYIIEQKINIIRNWLFADLKKKNKNIYYKIIELILLDSIKLYSMDDNIHLEKMDYSIFKKLLNLNSVKEFEKYVLYNDENITYSEIYYFNSLEEVVEYINQFDPELLFIREATEEEVTSIEEMDSYKLEDEEFNEKQQENLKEDEELLENLVSDVCDEEVNQMLFAKCFTSASYLNNTIGYNKFNLFKNLENKNIKIITRLSLFQIEKFYYSSQNMSFKYKDILLKFQKEYEKNAPNFIEQLATSLLEKNNLEKKETLVTILKKYYVLTKYAVENNLLAQKEYEIDNINKLENTDLNNILSKLNVEITKIMIERVFQFDLYQLVGDEFVIVDNEELIDYEQTLNKETLNKFKLPRIKSTFRYVTEYKKIQKKEASQLIALFDQTMYDDSPLPPYYQNYYKFYYIFYWLLNKLKEKNESSYQKIIEVIHYDVIKSSLKDLQSHDIRGKRVNLFKKLVNISSKEELDEIFVPNLDEIYDYNFNELINYIKESYEQQNDIYDIEDIDNVEDNFIVQENTKLMKFILEYSDNLTENTELCDLYDFYQLLESGFDKNLANFSKPYNEEKRYFENMNLKFNYQSLFNYIRNNIDYLDKDQIMMELIALTSNIQQQGSNNLIEEIIKKYYSIATYCYKEENIFNDDNIDVEIDHYYPIFASQNVKELINTLTKKLDLFIHIIKVITNYEINEYENITQRLNYYYEEADQKIKSKK